ALSEVWGKGGEGGIELAEEVLRLVEGENDFHFVYEDDLSLKEKIEAVATKIYRADGVDFDANAKKQLATIESLGFGNLPVCMAKTQYSFSDNASLLGAPRDFRITIRDVKVCSGAGFVVVKTGDIMTMPGLPKVPSAEKIDVDDDGVITGLF
ncbi:MAG: formate--tetrahydrofolate ligase, partial [Firmicutes bacterium]|nr:formate--tetrahydrofolate ligase [Bacillota bacterium]